MWRSRTWIAAITLAALTVAGCTGESDADKAGGSGRPITLRIGTDEKVALPAADAIREFARQADERSDGQIRITPVWQAAGENADDWDQAVANMVIDGDLDMGMIPSRAWDTEGVTSLRALNAPFLVTSDEQLGEVVSDDNLAGDMMAGLDDVGVHGLALVPEGLRHPFGFGEPLIEPADYAGATIRVPRSDTTYALFTALGAHPDDLGPTWGDDALSGAVAGAETSFVGALDMVPSIATANVTLFPKVESLVVNADVFAGLTDEQQTTLRDAAEATRDWAVAETPDEHGDAQWFCQLGGQVVWADEADVDALERATAPVYADLEADPGTRSMIAAIRGATDRAPAPVPAAPCDPPARPVVDNPPPEGVTIPEGVIRVDADPEDLVDKGVPPGVASDWDGIITITLRDGRWSLEQAGRAELKCEGPYVVDRGRVRFIFDGACGDNPDGAVGLDAAWAVDNDGGLALSDFRGGPGVPLPEWDILLGDQQWEPIE
jgi:TRAP-type C4-dicarboxylate transport system substrate-binding protein